MVKIIYFIFNGLLIWFLIWLIRMWWYINKWIFIGMIITMILLATGVAVFV